MGIVTDGLSYYWNHKQGINSNSWENISPNSQDTTVGIITGATIQEDGLYFDGVDDAFINPSLSSDITGDNITLEIILYGNLSDVSATTYLLGFDDSNSIVASSSRLDVKRRGAFTLATTANSLLGITGVCHIIVSFDGTKYVTYINNVRYQRNNSLGFTTSSQGIRFTPNVGIHLKVARIYNRALTDAEVQQNYAVGDAIGLEDIPTMVIPSVSITSVDKNRLSNNLNMDRTNISFSFDTDVTEWVVRVMGSSYDTGTIADSGGAVLSNTEITAEIDWTELYQEGENRVNIYGRNSNGEWTLYSE